MQRILALSLPLNQQVSPQLQQTEKSKRRGGKERKCLCGFIVGVGMEAGLGVV